MPILTACGGISSTRLISRNPSSQSISAPFEAVAAGIGAQHARIEDRAVRRRAPLIDEFAPIQMGLIDRERRLRHLFHPAPSPAPAAVRNGRRRRPCPRPETGTSTPPA